MEDVLAFILKKVVCKNSMKKLIFILLLIALALCLVGCPFTVDENHTQNHANVIDYNATEIHKFMDRYFWMYDWEDPYVN